MRLSFQRGPKSDQHPRDVVDFDGYLAPAELGKDVRALDIGFQDNPGGKGSAFKAYILSDQFGDLAKEMLKADPRAAIKAFGMALQEFPG